MTKSSQAESLNVLILSEDFYPKISGGAFIDWNVAKHLAAKGDDVTVVTPRNAQTEVSETVDGVKIRRRFRGPPPGVHPVSIKGVLWRLLFLALVVPYLCYLVWDQEFDLVYSTNHLCYAPAAILSTAFALPHVSFVSYSPSMHNNIRLINPLLLLERLNFRLFMGERVLSQTPSIRKILRQTCNAQIVRADGIVDRRAVEAAVESNNIPEIEFNSETDIQLIYVGRLVEIKNPTKLPPLVAQLPSEYSLLIVGDGPKQDSVRAAIGEHDVNERVHLLGRLPHKQTLQAIHWSDILVLPSKTEAYPTVVFEALSLNTPVIATPVGALPSIDHSKLTLAQLEGFSDYIQSISIEAADGIDEETLKRFSVNRFTRNVRNHMIETIN